MLRMTAFTFLITIAAIALIIRLGIPNGKLYEPVSPPTWWDIQSVDTMKQSRDMARETLNDPDFVRSIDRQMDAISKTGATHVAIATPYDAQFIPILTSWVTSARNHGLRVWFRGNFSGWERWFDYPQITRGQHNELLESFITKNPALFKDGDLFTPCPECENGGPGDPRQTRDVVGHRDFLITEHRIASKAFGNIGKAVSVGYHSMNFDVAKLIMDRETTKALGGIVTIDHYVKSPEKLAGDVRAIAAATGGRVFLGEIGAPIPDINGKMTESQQHEWIAKALRYLQEEPSVVGVNYWVHMGGSTAIWDDSGSPRKAVTALTDAFRPAFATGRITNQFNKPIKNATVQSVYKKAISGPSGRFIIPYLPGEHTLSVVSNNTTVKSVQIDDLSADRNIIIYRTGIPVFDRISSYLNALFK